jgi:NAD(P)H-dependent flavin oxidoreductase YrpB (nitropropane dioxygenase family)
MPLQNLLVANAHNRMNSGDDPDTISMPAGQIVGRTNEVRPVEDIMRDLIAEYDETVERLEKIRG